MTSEKQSVALSSVIAAIFLTAMKIAVGLMTGSLGILSEAAHSALDLGAAVVTYFAVRFSDKPADEDHNYGHGKIESFSALIETALLLLTCVWIIREAFAKLILGNAPELNGTFWGIAIMVLSIAINMSRAAALKKAAQKFGSQALEADALHFDTDVWSSWVVLVGLAMVWLGEQFNWSILAYSDPIAALGVCVLVIMVSLKLGKQTIDVLLDAAPQGMTATIRNAVLRTDGVLEVESIRIRPSGPTYFIDLTVGIDKFESHRVVHTIVEEIREHVLRELPNSDVVISTYPVEFVCLAEREIYYTVKKVVDRFPQCTNIHNIHVYEVEGHKHIAIHLEVRENLTLKESHDLSHEIGDLVQMNLADVKDVSVNFEYVKQQPIVAEDITMDSQYLIGEIDAVINKVPEKLFCHDVKVYRQAGKLTLFLHCEIAGDYATEKIERISESLSKKIRNLVSNIESVYIHVEPIE
jgi:cation diffusion facilitator family transporter